MADIRIAEAESRVYRAPLDTPVQTSFGIMRDRPMVLLLLRASDGVTGLGEVWYNFPAEGADYKSRLFASVVAPSLMARAFADPGEAAEYLDARVATLAIQCGEPGPFSCLLAAVDQALCDIAAQREGVALWRWLGAGKAGACARLCQRTNPTAPEALAAARLDEGYAAFKLKIGFSTDRDRRNLDGLQQLLRDDAALMVDANQAWTLEQAREALCWLSDYGLRWLEEPMRADLPARDWEALARDGSVPLAAGGWRLARTCCGSRIFARPFWEMRCP
ncbi:enolase C-terminal domain-like protein [Roseovarius sp.]|uniref:enolase C-terminal domain-like protein n=1 Tax=Roseovarius sp. TaxID=1486281 RepID=UPI0035657B3D